MKLIGLKTLILASAFMFGILSTAGAYVVRCDLYDDYETIYLGAGDHHLTTDGCATNPFVITGNATFYGEVQKQKIKRITVQSSATDVTLRRLIVDASGSGEDAIHINGGSGSVRIYDTDIKNGDCGIWTGDGRYVYVSNCDIDDNLYTGIDNNNNADSYFFVYNTSSEDNGQQGFKDIGTDDDDQGSYLYNSMFGFNTLDGALIEDKGDAYVYYSSFGYNGGAGLKLIDTDNYRIKYNSGVNNSPNYSKSGNTNLTEVGNSF